MICKIFLLGLAGLALAGEPGVFDNYFDDTIKEVDISLDIAIKGCLQNGDTFADKVRKAYGDCFGSADYSFGELAANEGGKDSDNDGLPDSFEGNEKCFYKKIGWVDGAGNLSPDAIKGDLAGRTERNLKRVIMLERGIKRPNLEERDVNKEITRKKEKGRTRTNLKRVRVIRKGKKTGNLGGTIRKLQKEITNKEKERGRKGKGKTKIMVENKKIRKTGTIKMIVVERMKERKGERKEEKKEEITMKTRLLKAGTIMVSASPPITNYGVLIFHWSKFYKNVWKTR